MVDDTILRYPAIQVRQRIGSFWAVSVPAQVLLRYTMPDRLRMIADPAYEGTDQWRQHVRFLGNQRELQLQRLKAIASYVDGVDSTFPNSLILAAPSRQVDDLEGEPWRLERSDDGCDHIMIPPAAAKASVVDGQHRLYSFFHSQIEQRQEFELLCSVFFDMPSTVQAFVFATINTTQKAVRRGMALNLYGYDIDDEPRERWSPEKVAVFLARRLNFDEDSPLWARVKIDAEGAPVPILLPGATRALPLAALVDGILRQISQRPESDREHLRSERLWKRATRRRDLEPDPTPLREWYRKERDADIYSLLVGYTRILDELLWRRKVDRSMLTRAVGVRALFDFLAHGLSRMPEIEKNWDSSAQAPLSSLEHALQPAADIDFANSYFEATGRGQKRILNALMVAAGWRQLAEFGDADREELQALVPGPSA